MSSSPPTDYEFIEAALPGLADLYRTSLARRELAAAWQVGLTTSPGGGIIHSPSLFAPLRKHDREGGNQVVVTVHDTLAITHPESLSAAESSWRRAMLKRARKHADAVVVSTHALANRLADQFDFGDRIRVISPAARSGLAIPSDASRPARRHSACPVPTSSRSARSNRIVAWATSSPPSGGRACPSFPSWCSVRRNGANSSSSRCAEESGVRRGFVRSFDSLSDADLAVVLGGATAFVAPAHEEGDPATLIEAFTLGTPVIHSDMPEYAEVAAGAGLSVPIGVAGEAYVNRLAAAISTVATDDTRAERLSITGQRPRPGVRLAGLGRAGVAAARRSLTSVERTTPGSWTNPRTDAPGDDPAIRQSWNTAAAARAS